MTLNTPEPTTGCRPSNREHRRNMVALELAALDLMSVERIRCCAETIGIKLPPTETIRQELLR